MFNVLHIALVGLLGYVAYLQFNDPDPIFWVTLYTLAALVPLLSIVSLGKTVNRAIIGIATGYCLAGLAVSLPGLIEYLQYHMGSESLVQDMSPERPYIEEGREFIGTAFAQAVVVLYWMFGKR